MARQGGWGLALLGALALGYAACSTAPSGATETEVLIKRRQAVDYAAQGDQNLVNQNWSQAEVFYRQSLEANWAVDNLAGVVKAHFSLGFLYLGLGRVDEAEAEYREAEEAAAMLGDAGLRAECLVNRAKVALTRGKAAEALALLGEADALQARDSGDKDGSRRASLLQTRGQAYKDLGKLAEASADLNAALAINTKRKAIKEPAANLYLLASIANQQGEGAKALGLIDQALELDKQAENSEGIAKDLYARSVLLQKLPGADGKPRLAEAWEALVRSYRVALAINDAVSVERDLVQLQDLARRLGKTREEAHYASALERLKAAQAKAQAANKDNK